MRELSRENTITCVETLHTITKQYQGFTAYHLSSAQCFVLDYNRLQPSQNLSLELQEETPFWIQWALYISGVLTLCTYYQTLYSKFAKWRNNFPNKLRPPRFDKAISRLESLTLSNRYITHSDSNTNFPIHWGYILHLIVISYKAYWICYYTKHIEINVCTHVYLYCTCNKYIPLKRVIMLY